MCICIVYRGDFCSRSTNVHSLSSTSSKLKCNVKIVVFGSEALEEHWWRNHFPGHPWYMDNIQYPNKFSGNLDLHATLSLVALWVAPDPQMEDTVRKAVANAVALATVTGGRSKVHDIPQKQSHRKTQTRNESCRANICKQATVGEANWTLRQFLARQAM